MLGLRIKKKIERLTLPVRSAAARSGLFLNSNDRRLWSLRDRHAGEECVLIGMGPSLRQDDLDRFSGYRTFACNKIFLALEERSWRPDYYFVSDILVAENNKEQINTSILESCERMYSERVAGELENYGDPLVFKWRRRIADMDRAILRTNPLEGLLGGGMTVLFEMLQIAYIMGFQKVYLVGLDFSFVTPAPTGEKCPSGEVLRSEGEVNHFHPNYRKIGETWTVPKMEEQRAAFAYAAEVFKASDRELWNASRETKLDSVQRIPFQDVFGG